MEYSALTACISSRKDCVEIKFLHLHVYLDIFLLSIFFFPFVTFCLKVIAEFSHQKCIRPSKAKQVPFYGTPTPLPVLSVT